MSQLPKPQLIPSELSPLDPGIVETLLGFFTDEGDWPYLMDYERYGIVAADVTHPECDTYPLGRKRIVVQLQCGTLYSVIRMGGMITPPGVWEAALLDPAGNWMGVEPRYYTINELFDTFKEHAQS